MRNDIIQFLKQEIYLRAIKPENKFGMGVYYHKLSIEEKIVADADAISHFDSIPSLLYLAYVNKNMDIENGANFVKNKLQRSFNKLSQESKEFYTQKYNEVMKIF
jgi:uncharacterized protein